MYVRWDIASLATLSILRWDAAVQGRVPDELRAELAIAMAQRTYKAYRELLRSPRWQRIYNSGGRPQRVLWDLTGPKDSKATDLTYTTALTAQFTVMAMTKSTLQALASRGEITTLLRADGGPCEETLARFRAAGIDLYAVARQLREEGLSAAVSSWTDLMAAIESKVATRSADAHGQKA